MITPSLSSVRDKKPTEAREVDLQDFQGFINIKIPIPGAMLFASQIYNWPVPKQVTQRMILWTGACVYQNSSGAAAYAWKEAPDGTKESLRYTKEGVRFPYKTNNPHLMSLFGIVAALHFAIMKIDTPSTNIRHLLEQDDQLYDYAEEWYPVELTRSHTHLKTKELFIFTESRDSMIWLLSRKSQRNEEVRAQIKDIKTMSEEIERSGIHIEIHLCPSVDLAPGKDIANQMARELAKDDLVTGLSV